MKQARDIMSTKVWSVVEQTDLPTLAKMLRQLDISGAPVLDRFGRPVGVVSMYDLVHMGGRESDSDDRSSFWGNQSLPRGFHQIGDEFGHLRVGDIMTPAVYSVTEETPIYDLCDFFVKGQIHRVLVLRDGELTGIITATDLIAALQAELAAPARA